MNEAAGRPVVTPGGSSVRLLRYRAAESQPLHAHERSTITLILGGGLEEQVGGRLERAAPLSLVVKPAGVPHANRFGDRGATTLQIELSPEDEERSRRAGLALGRWRWIHMSEAVRPMLGLANRLGAPEATGPPVGDLMAETLGALDPPPGDAELDPPSWLVQARHALAERAVPIRTLSLEAGVHPIHLAREFRRHFGLPPTRFRSRMRLWRAAGLLSLAHDPLATVALEVGFADQAHMTRAFRGATGVTPLALRRIARLPAAH